MEKNTTKFSNKWGIAAGLLVVILVIAVMNIVRTIGEYRASQNIYDQTNQDYVNEWEEPAADVPPAWYQLISVDLEGLQTQNPEITGWIYFENEPSVSYPILHANSNSKYLKTAWQGERAVAGSIFMERNNAADFSDYHTILYGHNMRNLSMFGKLRYYRSDPSYYPDHAYFQIITKDRYERFRIVAYKDVSVKSKLYTIWMTGGEEYLNFIWNTVLKDSMISQENAWYEPGPEDRLVTLSTCNNSDGKRFAVTGWMVDQQLRTPVS